MSFLFLAKGDGFLDKKMIQPIENMGSLWKAFKQEQIRI